MKIKGLILTTALFMLHGIPSTASDIVIGGNRPQKTQPWVEGTIPTEETPTQEITTTTEATTTKPGNILQTGIKKLTEIKNILTPTPSRHGHTDGSSGHTGQSDYNLSSSGLGLGGGAGSVSVNTGDITIGDIKALVTTVTKCENNISSGCGTGSMCNITVGPCSVTTQGLNAAPTALSFTRYLTSNNATIVTVQEMIESKKPQVVPLQLTAQNNYTMIIKYKSGGLRDISYMIMALPTEKNRVDTIKNLPLGLASYLKKQRGTIIKIYECPNPDKTSMWTEVSEQKIPVSLSNAIALQSNIINVEITNLGTLAVTYRNMKNGKGQIVPVTRVVYTHFIK